MRKQNFFSFVFLGNILEHHDKALISLLVPLIAQQFFESSDSISVLIQAYSALFLGLLARPLGALFFGIFADRKGRLKTLSITLLGMSLATFCIGCLPSYEKIGFLAPLFLTLLRGMQNFFAAGETCAAAVFSIEQSRLKTLTGSLFEASTVAGILLASLELALLSYFDQLHHWPKLFWLAGIIGLIGFYIRRDAASCEENIPNSRFSLRNLNVRALLAVTIAAGFSRSTYVMSITFINSFLTLTSNVPISTFNELNLFLLILDASLLPLFGWLALKWNYEKMMMFAATAMSLLAIPLFQALENASLQMIIFIRMIIVSIGACFAACFYTWAESILLPNQRCTIISIGCSAAHLLIEGPFILLCLWAFQYTHWTACPGIFLSAISLMTLFSLIKRYETHPIKVTQF